MADEKSKQLAPIDEVQRQLGVMQVQLKAVLPASVTPQRFCRVVMIAIQRNPKLLEANRASLYTSALLAASDGLLPDGRDGALVIFKENVQWLPMVWGIVRKVRNSGELSSLTAQIVCEKDRFRYWVDGAGPHLEHEPVVFGERGAVMGAYAIANTKDGGVYIDVMSVEEIEKRRAVSRAKDGPWNHWWEEMAMKTVIKHLAKRLPTSAEIDELLSRDEELTLPEPKPAPTSVEATKPARRLDSVIDAAQAGADAAAPDPVAEAQRKLEETRARQPGADLPESEKLPFEKDGKK